MTVSELIRIHQGRPDSLRVVVDDCRKDYGDLSPEWDIPCGDMPEHRDMLLGRPTWRPEPPDGPLPDGVEIAEAPAFRRAINWWGGPDAGYDRLQQLGMSLKLLQDQDKVYRAHRPDLCILMRDAIAEPIMQLSRQMPSMFCEICCFQVLFLDDHT